MIMNQLPPLITLLTTCEGYYGYVSHKSKDRRCDLFERSIQALTRALCGSDVIRTHWRR